MKILHLDSYEDRFLDYSKKFFKDKGKKAEWFDPSLSHSLVNRYRQYPHWSFLVDDNEELIAFSCIQTHFYPMYCARVLTRTFYHPQYRRHTLNYETDTKTPAMYMLEDQTNWIKENLTIDHLFFSVEHLRRKSSLIKLANKLNHKYNTHWTVLDDLYQTYHVDEKTSWQIICVNSTNLKDFRLKHITVDEWKEKYD